MKSMPQAALHPLALELATLLGLSPVEFDAYAGRYREFPLAIISYPEGLLVQARFRGNNVSDRLRWKRPVDRRLQNRSASVRVERDIAWLEVFTSIEPIDAQGARELIDM